MTTCIHHYLSTVQAGVFMDIIFYQLYIILNHFCLDSGLLNKRNKQI